MDDFLGFFMIAVIGVILALVVWAGVSADKQVMDAKTPEELRIACEGRYVRSAPLKCLEVIKEK